MHHLTHHHYHAMRLTKLAELNAVHTLRTAASGISMIFVTLLLFNLEYSLPQITGYLLMLALFWLATQYPALWVVRKLGVRLTLSLAVLSGITQFILLITLPTLQPPLALIALFGGIEISLYWLSFRIAFTQALAHHNAGKNIGLLHALLILASGATPAIGGIIASLFGTSVLYGVAVGLFALMLVPIFYLPGVTVPKIKPLPLKKVAPDVTANSVSNVDEAVAQNIWPLFIFLFLPSYAEVGILTSIGLLVAIGVALYVGIREERKGVRRYLHEGSGLAGAANFLRVLADSATHVFGINFVAGVGKSLLGTPFETRYYANTEKYGPTYIVAMLAGGAAGWVVYFSILTVLALLLSTKLALLVGLFIGAPLVLLMNRIR